MKIEIEIPKEFEIDYNSDKFEDFFARVFADIKTNEYSTNSRYLCGNYEKETAYMFWKAFQNSIEKK